ncbi:MAG: hypothetical protein LBB67_04565 [Oscillospiraceae bacterium]|nr:hypothetical protein [Oscillospiraceae bacterium]
MILVQVVAIMKQEMRGKLDEEIARAILIGDGRNSMDEDKINEECIRPIVCGCFLSQRQSQNLFS